VKGTIKKTDSGDEYFFEEGCYIVEQSNSIDDPDLSIARARVPVGVTTRWHCLQDTVERYLIQAGTGAVAMGKLSPQQVGPGDVVIIPAGVAQRISNTGTSDLVFTALCTPRFVPSAYRDLEPSNAE
jgi:mannose-6-phosphate isomerase-like protein (cupin superfamily)